AQRTEVVRGRDAAVLPLVDVVEVGGAGRGGAARADARAVPLADELGDGGGRLVAGAPDIEHLDPGRVGDEAAPDASCAQGSGEQRRDRAVALELGDRFGVTLEGTELAGLLVREQDVERDGDADVRASTAEAAELDQGRETVREPLPGTGWAIGNAHRRQGRAGRCVPVV